MAAQAGGRQAQAAGAAGRQSFRRQPECLQQASSSSSPGSLLILTVNVPRTDPGTPTRLH